MSKKFDKRKKVVYDLICDDLYTPMKFKELAILLRVAKEDRDELDPGSVGAGRKDISFQERKILQGTCKASDRCVPGKS